MLNALAFNINVSRTERVIFNETLSRYIFNSLLAKTIKYTRTDQYDWIGLFDLKHSKIGFESTKKATFKLMKVALNIIRPYVLFLLVY